MGLAAEPRFTPQEVAALSGTRLRRAQNALTERLLGRAFPPGVDGRRWIDLSGLMTFAAIERMPSIRVAPRALYRAFHRTGGLPTEPVTIDQAVTIDAPALLAPVVRKVHLYERARTLITSDPGVRGGVPVVKGTRLPASMPRARVTAGDSIATILEEYPYLDQETIEAAVLFAEANPQRGRPRLTERRPRRPAGA